MQYIPRGRVHFEIQRWKILNKKKKEKKRFCKHLSLLFGYDNFLTLEMTLDQQSTYFTLLVTVAGKYEAYAGIMRGGKPIHFYIQNKPNFFVIFFFIQKI